MISQRDSNVGFSTSKRDVAGVQAEKFQDSYAQLRSDLAKFRRTAGLIGRLLPFFRNRISLDQAKDEIRWLLETRRDRFLDLTRRCIFENPSSPYLRLLQFVGCEFSDFRAQIHREGVERTLEKLAAEGVYLTSDEYKGKKPVVRGNMAFMVRPSDFEPSASRAGFVVQSSGTTNSPVRTFTPVEWLGLRTLGTAVFSSAHGLNCYSQALYDAILPASSINHLLMNAKMGVKTDRWFARPIPINNAVEGWYHYLATHAIVATGQLFGPGLPRPEFSAGDTTRNIVRWILEQKKIGKPCYVISVASSAVKIARMAREMNVSLDGTKFNVAGEPFTETKEEIIKEVGATTTSRYSYGGGIPVGYGCGNPEYRDEVHVNQHLLAVINHPRPLDGAPITIHPLLLTTVHPAAPRLLLNVENGDYVTLNSRECACEMQKVGLTVHLCRIRSYEKFTSEGMNYFYGDLFDLIENVLPGEFGGGPGDYQVLEEEDREGQTRLTLVVHPAIRGLDERRILARVQEAFSNGSRGNRFMTRVWENAGTFRVKRSVPHTSPRGKILPLHILSNK